MMRTSRVLRWPIALVMLFAVLVAVWWLEYPRGQRPVSTVSMASIRMTGNRLAKDDYHPEGYRITNLPATAKPFTYVATFSMDGFGMDLLPSTAGFLTREGDCYIMHDWHNGHAVWQVTPSNAKGWGQPGGPWSEIDNASFALSDDGRYFTTSTVQANGVRVQRWNKGKPDGDCLVLSSHKGSPKPGYYQLAIGNTGRVCMQYYFEEPAPPPEYLLVIDGYRMTARATLPAHMRVLPGGVLAFDAEARTLYAIKVTAGQVHFTKVAHNVPDFLKFPGNYLLADDGAVFNPKGRSLPPNLQRKLDDEDHYRMSDGWPTDWLVFSTDKNQHKIYSLSTQASWSLKSKSGLKGVAVSSDGRYVLMHNEENRKNGLPVSQHGQTASDTESIWLYERPGILRAALRYDPEKLEPFEGDDRIIGESCYRWVLSPDGKSVVLKYQYMGIGGEAMLYTW